MASTISPNMSLIIPTVGTQPGPDYASNINSDLTLLDQHDHSPGRGVQITPAGLNINDDLSIQNNNIIDVNDLILTNQNSGSTNLQALYVKPGTEGPAINDLWFNDGDGNAVQITSGGLVNATIGSLPGQSYAAGTFYWKQGTGSTTPANFDIGSITIRPNIALTSFGVTVSPSSSISSAYTVNLPLLPSGGTKIMSMNTSGEMFALIDVDNSTIQLSSNTLSVKTSGITATQLASDSVITAKILDGNVTAAKLASDSVTTIKILDSNVTTAKINDLAVTRAKTAVYYFTATIGTDGSWVSTEAKTIGNFAVIGRPVRITCYTGAVTMNSAGAQIQLQYSSNGSSFSEISQFGIGSVALTRDYSGSQAPAIYVHNAPSAGTAYYRLQMVGGNGSIGTALQLIVEEL